MWLQEALEQNVGLDGVDGVDTPWTVMTTRAPAVLKALDVETDVKLVFHRLYLALLSDVD